MAEHKSKADELPSQQEMLEDTNVVRLFSKPAAVKILTVLVDLGGTDAPVSTIAEKAGVSRNGWYNNKDLLLELELVEETRSEAGATFYAANFDNPAMDGFIQLRDHLAAPSE